MFEQAVAIEAASCDGARLHWYLEVSDGRAIPSAPSISELDDILEIREAASTEDYPTGEAELVAYHLESYFGWPVFRGVVIGEDGVVIRPHAWNLLPEGGIIDAASDLVGGHGIRVCLPTDPEWSLYRREWTTTYNPDLASLPDAVRACKWSRRPDMEIFSDALTPSGPSPTR